MLLNLRELNAFKAIVDSGSLGRAAEALNLTQPALSRIIKRLEDQLGVPLFERHQRGVSLTEYGARLEPFANLLLSESQRAVQEIEAMRGLEKGVVRVGAVVSALGHLVPTAVEQLLRKWPGLQVHLVEALSEDLINMLVKGDIDLALAFSVPASDEVLQVSQSEWQEGCHVVVGASHPLFGRPDLALADLQGHRWALAPRGTQPREEWRQAFAARSLTPPVAIVESRSVTALRSLVATGGFLGWMPKLLVGNLPGDAAALSVLPVRDVKSFRRFALYHRREGTMSPATVGMRDELLAQIRALTF